MRLIKFHAEWWKRLPRHERIGYKVMYTLGAGTWTGIGIARIFY